jgi:hypothetical protein
VDVVVERDMLFIMVQRFDRELPLSTVEMVPVNNQSKKKQKQTRSCLTDRLRSLHTTRVA